MAESVINNISFVEKAEKTREFIVSIAKELIREKTVNYNSNDYPDIGPDGMESPGEESKAVNVLISYFEKIGISYKIFQKYEKRKNLIASLGLKKPGYRRLLVLLHTDVVPSGGRELWGYDPFVPLEKDGFLYGRGAADNKGQLAAVMSTFFMLQKMEELIKGEFILGAFADEEVGIAQAGFEVVDEELNFGSYITDAIVPDTSGNNIEIERAEKGRFVIKTIVTGKQAHGSMPWKGANAIYAFSEFALLVEKHQFEFRKHPLLNRPSVNLGLIKGGNSPNNVAALCEGTFDIRTLPGMTKEGVVEELNILAKKVKRKDINFTFEVVLNTEPTEVPEKAPVVKTIKKFVPHARTIGIGGITFCKHLISRGIHAVGWGPGTHENVHTANECISIQELVDFAGLLAEIAFNLCNQKA